MTTISTRFNQLQDRLRQVQQQSPLASGQLMVLAATKGQPAAVLHAAIAAGITDFGENRVQEAHEKWPPLRAQYPGVRLHLIGPLQRNKVGQAIALFDGIQSLDRMALADALAAGMAGSGRRVPCHIQVNTGKEPQKAGVMPEQADALIEYCIRQLHLPIAGLMCVPPHNQPPAPHFAWLRELAARHHLSGLSMGMSDDYETAVRLGATCIRLGRALFGER